MEKSMAPKVAAFHTPYHLSPHTAPVLLGPVGANLAELEARLVRYAERVHMSDADRAVVTEALGVVADARERLARLAAKEK